MMIWMIGIGGSLGAAARFLLGNLISRGTQKINPFPIGTWIINITGSFLLGVLTGFHLTNRNQRLAYGFLLELVFVVPIQLFQPLETKPLP